MNKKILRLGKLGKLLKQYGKIPIVFFDCSPCFELIHFTFLPIWCQLSNKLNQKLILSLPKFNHVYLFLSNSLVKRISCVAVLDKCGFLLFESVLITEKNNENVFMTI